MITPRPWPYDRISTVTSRSPDGIWIAEDRWDQDSGQETFKIYKEDGSLSWTLFDRNPILGDNLVSMWDWSMDSRHFYFQYVGSGEAGEGKCNLFGIQGFLQLLRFDVQTGQITRSSLPEGSEHRISPDETLLAYIRSGKPLQLVLRKIKTGAEQTIPLPIYHPPIHTGIDSAGDIHWSPNGHSLVLSITNGTICGESKTSTLLRVDLEPLAMTELIREDKTFIFVKRWPVAWHILVEDLNDSTWWIDALTGETVSAP
jgi:hypothetical protein